MLGGVEAAKAIKKSTSGYLRIGLNGQIRRDDYTVWPGNPVYGGLTGTIGAFVEARKANFAITRGFRSFGQDEDIDLSNFIRFGVYAAPKAFGYGDQSGVGGLMQVRLGTQLPFGFAWFDTRVNGVLGSGGLDSGSVVLGATSVIRPMAKQMLILHADVGWLKDPIPGSEFDLGCGRTAGLPDPRLSPGTGLTTTAEYRMTFVDASFKVLALGAATFVDHGGAWYEGSPTRTGTDVGLGLRLAPSRAADANTTRLDLAYRFDNDRLKAGWVFVFASGLVFSTSPRGGGGS